MDRKVLAVLFVAVVVVVTVVYLALYSNCIGHMEEYEPGRSCCFGLEVVSMKDGTKYCVVPGMDLGWVP